jgi:hypothetical protein
MRKIFLGALVGVALAVNVQSSNEMNLETMGPDNTPLLTVRVP